MKLPSHISLRVSMLFLALVLGAQGVWLLLADFYRPSIRQLPADSLVAAAAARARTDAERAASIGFIRGDLWAESAFTYADLLWGTHPNDAQLTQMLGRAQASLNRALSNAPDQSDAWLLLAGLALRYRLPHIEVIRAIKMSYYTGPSSFELMPLRLSLAVQSSGFGDVEFQQMIARDLHLLRARQQNLAISAAYEGASPAGKALHRADTR